MREGAKRAVRFAPIAMREAPEMRASELKGRPLTLAEQLAESISEDILLEKYQDDQKLVEQDVSEAFQVSRGPVRDAFRILESNGLVTILPRRGTRVTRLTIEEGDSIYDIRAVLFALAARRFVEKSLPKDLVQLEELVRHLSELAPYEDLQHRYASISQQASLLVASRCGNPRLAEIFGSLAPQTVRYTKLAIVSQRGREQRVKAWLNLLSAIKRGDTEAAAAAAQKLVEDAWRAARTVIQEGRR
jgi:DNA-binding GntR family transcriptional regulator